MNRASLVKEWFEFAASDLRVASHMFDNMHPKPLEIICYHCQQCVEKTLKGYLIDHDMDPPYIHDLEKLCLMCVEYDPSFEAFMEQCRDLTEYAASSRYPSKEEFEESNAVTALRDAKEIYAFCASLIPELRQEPEQNPQQSM